MLACTPRPNDQTPDPAIALQSLPAADPSKYQHVEMRNWRNPYLLLRADGVALLDTADNAEIILKPEEMLAALSRLPPSAWPYGRVVAISETEAESSDQDRIAIRRNKGIVGGMLQGAHVLVDWIPAKSR